jgi:hypothetical protein
MWAAGWSRSRPDGMGGSTKWMDETLTSLAVGRAGRTGGSPGGFGRGNESDGLKGAGAWDWTARRAGWSPLSNVPGPATALPVQCPLRKAVQPAALLRPFDKQAPSSQTASSMRCCAAAMQWSAPFGRLSQPGQPRSGRVSIENTRTDQGNRPFVLRGSGGGVVARDVSRSSLMSPMHCVGPAAHTSINEVLPEYSSQNASH